MNSIADALRKLHPEMNAKMVFAHERDRTPVTPRPTVLDPAALDEPIEFRLDAELVASALTSRQPLGAKGLSSISQTLMNDPLARRLMRRSLQAIALLSLAGLVGVVISSESVNHVSARVTARTLAPEAAMTQPVATLQNEPEAESAPSETLPVESPATILEAPIEVTGPPEAERSMAMAADEPAAGEPAPVENAGGFEAVQTGAQASDTDATLATPGDAQPQLVQIQWQPVKKAVPATASMPDAPARDIGREPIRSASVETIWSDQADLASVAEIPYESDAPLFEGDFAAAESVAMERRWSDGQDSPRDAPMRLEGIFWEKDRPLALINGEIVEQGAVFRGVTVLEIHRTRIVISEKGQKRVLVP